MKDTFKTRFYTTTKKATQSMAEIEEALVACKVGNISKFYDGGACTGLAFTYPLGDGRQVPFLIQVDVKRTAKVLYDDYMVGKTRPQKKESDFIKQAEMTAWAIEAESLVLMISKARIGQASLTKALLGYVATNDGKTLHDAFEAGQMKQLQISNQE